MASLGGQGATAPVQAVLALYEAIRDSRIADVLALVDPDVVCQPLVRPGLATYYGPDGMAALIRDMHAVHGLYQVEIAEITEQDGSQVTIGAVIVPEPGHGQPLRVTSVYAFRGGLIASIESSPGPLGNRLARTVRCFASLHRSSIAQLTTLVGEDLRLDPHEARPRASVRRDAVDHDGMAEDHVSRLAGQFGHA
jgi:hypothetical protein